MVLRVVTLVAALLLAGPSWGQYIANVRDANPPACRERADDVAQRIDRLVELHDYCRTDRDCAFLATSTRCGNACGAVVNRRVGARLGRQVRQLDRRHCPASLGCFPEPRFCPLQRAACLRNRCTALPLLPAPRPALPNWKTRPPTGSGVSAQTPRPPAPITEDPRLEERPTGGAIITTRDAGVTIEGSGSSGRSGGLVIWVETLPPLDAEPRP